jgi:hypothetical protein
MTSNADSHTLTKDPDHADMEAVTQTKRDTRTEDPDHVDKEMVLTKRETRTKDTISESEVYIVKELESSTVVPNPEESTSLPTDPRVRRPKTTRRKRLLNFLRRGGQRLCAMLKCGREEPEDN